MSINITDIYYSYRSIIPGKIKRKYALVSILSNNCAEHAIKMWALALCVLNMKYTTLLVPDRMWKHSSELIYQTSPSVGSDDSPSVPEGEYDDLELIE